MLNQQIIAGVHSVQLATATKAKIEGQLSILRGLIENSDMPTNRKSKLIAQLDNFAAELNQPRLNYAAVALIATGFLAGIQGVTSTLADTPNAYQTVGAILKWIGQDKDVEDRERERLGAPAQVLLARPKPASKPTQAPSSFGGFADDFDDDVPF